jgi:hypothetical protein
VFIADRYLEGSSMKCPYCQQEHADEALFCTVTGVKLEAIPQCENCNGLLHPAWKICPKCGTLVGESVQPVQTELQPRQKKRSRLKKIFIGFSMSVIGFLLLLVALVILDPFKLYLVERFTGRYDATAAVMPESTEIYLGINLLRIKPSELERYSPLVIPFLLLASEEPLLQLASTSTEDGSKGKFENLTNNLTATYKASLLYTDVNLLPNTPTTFGDLVIDFEAKYGIKFPDDLYPWVGQYVGVGILGFGQGDVSNSSPQIIIAVEARDSRAADRFLSKVTEGVVNNQGGYIDQENYRGNTITVHSTEKQGEKLVFSRSGRIILFAFDENTIKAAIDAHETNTLSGNPAFIQLSEVLPSNRFMSFYLSRGWLDNASSRNGLVYNLIAWNLIPATSISSWQGSMFTARSIDSGLQIDFYSTFDRRNLNSRDMRLLAEFGSPGQTIDMLPEETLFYMTGTRPDLYWEMLSDALAEEGNKEVIKVFLKKTENWLRINLREDVINYLDDEWVFALIHTTDSYWSHYDNLDMGYIFATNTGGDSVPNESLKSQLDIVQEVYSDYLNRSQIHNYSFYEFFSKLKERPDVVIGAMDGYFILGSTTSLIQEVFSDRRSTSLSDTFKIAWQEMDENVPPVMYLDVQGLLKTIEENLSVTENQGLRAAAPYLQNVQSIVAGQSRYENEVVTNRFFVTFLEE